MAVAKSPFLVVRGFLSPKICEGIVDSLGLYNPDLNPEGDPIKMIRSHQESEELIYDRFSEMIPKIEEYYQFNHRGTESVMFEFYAEGTVSEPQCENSNWIKKKWVRTKDRDFSCILFLSSSQDQVPFDGDYEVYGGKLEFPQHQFGFNPERGTLIVFPSGPHFINAVAPIVAGDLFLARFHIASAMPYLYNPREFPGDYRSWFTGLM